MIVHGISRNWIKVNHERENNTSQRKVYKNHKTGQYKGVGGEEG